MTPCASLALTVPPDLSLAAIFAARVSVLLAEHDQTPTSATKDGRLGLTQQQLSDLVKGRHVPGGATVVAIAKHFGVSADWLLGLTIERRPLAVPRRLVVPPVGEQCARVNVTTAAQLGVERMDGVVGHAAEPTAAADRAPPASGSPP